MKTAWCAVLCVVCGVVWCGMVWCGVVWCGVVWCVAFCCVELCCFALCIVLYVELYVSCAVLYCSCVPATICRGRAECILNDLTCNILPKVALDVHDVA